MEKPTKTVDKHLLNPYEAQVYYIMPALRRELTKSLKGLGLSQKDIAKHLHVRDSTISQYSHSKRAGQIDFDEQVQKKIADAAEKIVKGESALQELIHLTKLPQIKKIMCELCGICEDKETSVCFENS